LVQVALNIVIVVNILFDLGSPLATLLIKHEILTVHVVEVDADLRSVRVTLASVVLLLLSLGVEIEVEPQLLDLDAQVVHVLSQFLQGNVSFNNLTHHLRVNNLNVNAIIVIENIKLDPFIVYRILIWLRWGLREDRVLLLSLNVLLKGDLDQRLRHDLGEVSHLDDIH